MAQLVQSFGGDTALRLQNEEFVRKMQWGSVWQKIGIYVNLSIPQVTGTFDGGEMYIGLCEGTTNTFKSGTTTEWVGCYVNNDDWNYAAGPPAGVSVTNPKWGYKQGAVLTQSGNSSVNNYIGKTFRDYWYTGLEQTATGYNAAFRAPNAVPTIDRINREFELLACQSEPNTSAAVNFSTNRRLDTVSIYWNYPSIGIEISEILVVRWA